MSLNEKPSSTNSMVVEIKMNYIYYNNLARSLVKGDPALFLGNKL